MSALRDTFRLGTFILLISIPFNSLELYTSFRMQFEKTSVQINGIEMLMLALLFYVVIFIGPYFNYTNKTMLLVSGLFMVVQYLFLLLSNLNFLQSVWIAIAVLFAIIGRALFTIQTVLFQQKIIKQHKIQSSSGRYFGVFLSFMCVGLTIGSFLSNLLFSFASWKVVALMGAATIIGIVFGYFFIKDQYKAPQEQLNQQVVQGQTKGNDSQRQEPANAGENNQNNPQNNRYIFRNNIMCEGMLKSYTNIGYIMLPLIYIQLSWGFFNSITKRLYNYLMWTTQWELLFDQKLYNSVIVIALIGLGGAIGSILSGILLDFFGVKRGGMVIMIAFCGVDALCLFMAVAFANYLSSVIILGFYSIFFLALLNFILTACCKLYTGKMEVYSLTFQLIIISQAVTQFGYWLSTSQISEQAYLFISLAIGTIGCVLNIFFGLNKLPDFQVDIEREIKVRQQSFRQNQDIKMDDVTHKNTIKQESPEQKFQKKLPDDQIYKDNLL